MFTVHLYPSKAIHMHLLDIDFVDFFFYFTCREPPRLTSRRTHTINSPNNNIIAVGNYPDNKTTVLTTIHIRKDNSVHTSSQLGRVELSLKFTPLPTPTHIPRVSLCVVCLSATKPVCFPKSECVPQVQIKTWAVSWKVLWKAQQERVSVKKLNLWRRRRSKSGSIDFGNHRCYHREDFDILQEISHSSTTAVDPIRCKYQSIPSSCCCWCTLFSDWQAWSRIQHRSGIIIFCESGFLSESVTVATRRQLNAEEDAMWARVGAL